MEEKESINDRAIRIMATEQYLLFMMNVLIIFISVFVIKNPAMIHIEKAVLYYRVFDFAFIPRIINIADVENIIGQSLNGRKSTRNPVNKDRIAKENNMPVIKT